jgi:hypothetical protein
VNDANTPVRVEVSAPEQVRAGAPVPFTLRAINDGADSAVLYLRGREIAFDLVVSRQDGQVVWQRLRDATIAAIAQVRELAPRESLTLEDRWDQRGDAGTAVGPGEYSVRGVLLTEGPPLESSELPFRVVR